MYAFFIADFACRLMIDFKSCSVNAKTSSCLIRYLKSKLKLSLKMKLKYKETDVIQFYKEYLRVDDSYPGLVQHPRRCVACLEVLIFATVSSQK